MVIKGYLGKKWMNKCLWILRQWPENIMAMPKPSLSLLRSTINVILRYESLTRPPQKEGRPHVQNTQQIPVLEECLFSQSVQFCCPTLTPRSRNHGPQNTSTHHDQHPWHRLLYANWETLNIEVICLLKQPLSNLHYCESWELYNYSTSSFSNNSNTT